MQAPGFAVLESTLPFTVQKFMPLLVAVGEAKAMGRAE